MRMQAFAKPLEAVHRRFDQIALVISTPPAFPGNLLQTLGYGEFVVSTFSPIIMRPLHN